MEILFPVGDITYLDAAIELKVDAVYGGLKLWNARNKAINFNLEELDEAIQKCHNNNIKFYLTINTLMLDNDIVECIKKLKQLKYLPDAFICTDIGLVELLNEKFPQVELHASTQFGVHNIYGIKGAKELGFSRAVLARELSFNELKVLNSSSEIGLEAFVFGSQCICFSGMCFLSSLCGGGCANRGKCLTFCRNRYKINNLFGNIMYSPDIDYTQSNFVLSGIKAIKIEGRRRPVLELYNAYKKINDTQKSKKTTTIDKVNFELVNTRQDLYYKYNSNDIFDKHDIWVNILANGEKRFVDKPSNISFYAYTEYRKPFISNAYNISFDLKINNHEVIEVLFLNHRGEAKYFNNLVSNEQDTILLNQKNIYKYLEINKKINIYRVTFKKPKSSTQIYINLNLLNKIKENLKKQYQELYSNELSQGNSCGIKNMIVETDNISIANSLANKGFSVIYNTDSTDILQLNIYALSEKLIFKLPILNFENHNLLDIGMKFIGRRVLFTRIEQIIAMRGIQFKEKICDYTIPIWNRWTLDVIKKYGISKFCSSPEISIEVNRKIFCDEPVIHFLAGNHIAGYSRKCFKELYNCRNCNKKIKKIKNIDNGIKYKIKCNKEYRTIIFADKAIQYIEEYSTNEYFRYVTFEESEKEILMNISAFNKKGYFTKMKKCSKYKNSYNNNCTEDKELNEN